MVEVEEVMEVQPGSERDLPGEKDIISDIVPTPDRHPAIQQSRPNEVPESGNETIQHICYISYQ